MSGSELLPSLKRATITVLEGDAELSGCAAPASTKRARVLDKGVSFASVVKVRAPVSGSEQIKGGAVRDRHRLVAFTHEGLGKMQVH